MGPNGVQGERKKCPREPKKDPGGASAAPKGASKGSRWSLRGVQGTPNAALGSPREPKRIPRVRKNDPEVKFYILGFILKDLYSKLGFQDLNFKFYIPSSIFEGCYTPRFLFQVYIPNFIKTIREGIRRLDSKIYISSVIFQVLYSRDVI